MVGWWAVAFRIVEQIYSFDLGQARAKRVAVVKVAVNGDKLGGTTRPNSRIIGSSSLG